MPGAVRRRRRRPPQCLRHAHAFERGLWDRGSGLGASTASRKIAQIACPGPDSYELRLDGKGTADAGSAIYRPLLGPNLEFGEQHEEIIALPHCRDPR